MPDTNTDKFQTILKDNDLHVTAARQVTFQILQGSGPLSMNDIIEKATGKIDRVSVYRNIDLFEKIGVVNRINQGWKYKIELSDKFVMHHHHISCSKCGKLVDIEDEKHIEEFINDIAGRSGFRVSRHYFEIEGLCAECQTS